MNHPVFVGPILVPLVQVAEDILVAGGSSSFLLLQNPSAWLSRRARDASILFGLLPPSPQAGELWGCLPVARDGEDGDAPRRRACRLCCGRQEAPARGGVASA